MDGRKETFCFSSLGKPGGVCRLELKAYGPRKDCQCTGRVQTITPGSQGGQRKRRIGIRRTGSVAEIRKRRKAD